MLRCQPLTTLLRFAIIIRGECKYYKTIKI
nr:MAG TPA: hypothetical protein [Caudoviricetes sp.]